MPQNFETRFLMGYHNQQTKKHKMGLFFIGQRIHNETIHKFYPTYTKATTTLIHTHITIHNHLNKPQEQTPNPTTNNKTHI